MSQKIEITENHVKDFENSFSNVSHKCILSGRYVIFFFALYFIWKKKWNAFIGNKKAI